MAAHLPVTVLNGKPGYINFLDALNGWQLVSELKKATGLRQQPLLSTFPGWCGRGLPLTDTLAKHYWGRPWSSFLRWHVPTQEREVQTECLPLRLYCTV